MRVSLKMDSEGTLAIQQVAAVNHRTVAAEIIVAIERHVRASDNQENPFIMPPKFKVDAVEEGPE